MRNKIQVAPSERLPTKRVCVQAPEHVTNIWANSKSNQRMQKWGRSSGPPDLARLGRPGWSSSASRSAALRGACASAALPARGVFSWPLVRTAGPGGRRRMFLGLPSGFCAFSESLPDLRFLARPVLPGLNHQDNWLQLTGPTRRGRVVPELFRTESFISLDILASQKFFLLASQKFFLLFFFFFWQ